MQGPYVDYSTRVVEHMCEICRHICLEAYAGNMNCMFTSASGHIVGSIAFILGIIY